jgi:hypothetical protein
MTSTWRSWSNRSSIAVSHLMKAMPSTPTAVLAWLERRFPQEWSRTERHELSGPEGGPVEVENARDKLLKKLDAISERLRAEDREPTHAGPTVVERDPGRVDRPRAIAMQSIP